MSSCGGKTSAPSPVADESSSTESKPADTVSTGLVEIPPASIPVDKSIEKRIGHYGSSVYKTEPRKIDTSANEDSSDDGSGPAASNNEDDAKAVDDDIWRLFEIADDYYAMGVIANQEASWEEAQYYFEKSLGILANLDIEADSTAALTPEAKKYNTQLSNVISDYRVTLRSLGRLEEDAPPSVLIERFAALAPRLGSDSLQIYSNESQPVVYDLPVVMNERVKKSIVYFQTVAREAFVRFLSRSKRYEALYKDVLSQHGLPHDLVYLSMVESGFNPHAYSWARAMGLWQFIASTGRMYGLKRDWWLDERKDPVKSTHAAARFLKDLYTQFGDWELAMAAYNCGPGRVSRTRTKQGTDDFWQMNLPQQTKDYVPLIFAATIISKDPEKYGFFDIVYDENLNWEEVTINKCLDLKTVASEVGCTVEEIKALNPELLRNNTPPNVKDYVLKVPAGKKDMFLASYENMVSTQQTNWTKHRIRRGESIASIAAKYGVSKYALLEANAMTQKTKIISGKDLIVPVPTDTDYSDNRKSDKPKYAARNSVYTVRSGDTMWDIAKAFNTSVDALRRMNYLEGGARIYVGQKLKLLSDGVKMKGGDDDSGPVMAAKDPQKSSASGTSAGSNYTVKSGDTIWDIAKRFNITASSLRDLNGLNRSSAIYPGQKLKVGNGSADGIEFIIHRVQSGDTISRIARTYRTSISRILESNGLADANNLKIGDKLKIQKN